MRKLKVSLYTVIFSLLISTVASAQSSGLVGKLVQAYGGEEALKAVETLQNEWVGYYIARHQSRTTEPPL